MFLSQLYDELITAWKRLPAKVKGDSHSSIGDPIRAYSAMPGLVTAPIDQNISEVDGVEKIIQKLFQSRKTLAIREYSIAALFDVLVNRSNSCRRYVNTVSQKHVIIAVEKRIITIIITIDKTRLKISLPNPSLVTVD